MMESFKRHIVGTLNYFMVSENVRGNFEITLSSGVHLESNIPGHCHQCPYAIFLKTIIAIVQFLTSSLSKLLWARALSIQFINSGDCIRNESMV